VVTQTCQHKFALPLNRDSLTFTSFLPNLFVSDNLLILWVTGKRNSTRASYYWSPAHVCIIYCCL